MRSSLLACALGLSVPLTLVPAVQAQTYKTEYKLSTVLPNTYPWGKAGER